MPDPAGALMGQREIRQALSGLESAAAHYHDEYHCGDRVTARAQAKAVRRELVNLWRLRKVLRGVMEHGQLLLLCDGRTTNELIDLSGARNIERAEEER